MGALLILLYITDRYRIILSTSIEKKSSKLIHTLYYSIVNFRGTAAVLSLNKVRQHWCYERQQQSR